MFFEAANSVTMNRLPTLSQVLQRQIAGSERAKMGFEAHPVENKQKKYNYRKKTAFKML